MEFPKQRSHESYISKWKPRGNNWEIGEIVLGDRNSISGGSERNACDILRTT